MYSQSLETTMSPLRHAGSPNMRGLIDWYDSPKLDDLSQSRECNILRLEVKTKSTFSPLASHMYNSTNDIDEWWCRGNNSNEDTETCTYNGSPDIFKKQKSIELTPHRQRRSCSRRIRRISYHYNWSNDQQHRSDSMMSPLRASVCYKSMEEALEIGKSSLRMLRKRLQFSTHAISPKKVLCSPAHDIETSTTSSPVNSNGRKRMRILHEKLLTPSMARNEGHEFRTSTPRIMAISRKSGSRCTPQFINKRYTQSTFSSIKKSIAKTEGNEKSIVTVAKSHKLLQSRRLNQKSVEDDDSLLEAEIEMIPLKRLENREHLISLLSDE